MIDEKRVWSEIRRVQRAIAAARHLRGMTQLQLGAKVGMLPTTLSAIECGRRVPTTYTLARLAVALGMTIEEMLKNAPAQDS
ncbi:MAG TPA: helix-turn-helix transcriptional regulator [Chloroflexi bacterium]|nr:helix-turn-helix transcriptional regulator [Chloroflexota bacterium]